MIYITGDTHRDFARLCNLNFTEDDILIILGDVGINYYLNEDDRKFAEFLSTLEYDVVCKSTLLNIKEMMECKGLL